MNIGCKKKKDYHGAISVSVHPNFIFKEIWANEALARKAAPAKSLLMDALASFRPHVLFNVPTKMKVVFFGKIDINLQFLL